MKKTLLLVVLVVLIGCGGNQPVSTADTPAPSAAVALSHPTVAPTRTPQPTNTPKPTLTPMPTRPTNTPAPTKTPLPTMAPIVLTGSGDSVVDVSKGKDPCIVHITGNASSRFFAVKNLDATGGLIDLLVNTTDPYEGWRPLDWRVGETTTMFEVSATGSWTIEVLPLLSAHTCQIPGTCTGTGDDVVLLIGSGTKAAIKGNASGRFFAIIGYANSSDLLVNTTDPYEGTVLLRGAKALEIRASDEWTITVSK